MKTKISLAKVEKKASDLNHWLKVYRRASRHLNKLLGAPVKRRKYKKRKVTKKVRVAKKPRTAPVAVKAEAA